MKLRTALKICNTLFGYRSIRHPRWRYQTARTAIAIGEKHWRDSRFPCIPDEREREEGFGICMSILADCFMPEEQAEQFKEQLWTELQ